MSGFDVVSWPSVRDVARQLDVSQGYVFRLLHSQPPRLRAVRTRIGYLLDPASVAEFEAERTTRLERRLQRST